MSFRGPEVAPVGPTVRGHGVETRGEHRAFGGTQGFYAHPSRAAAGPMRFGVFLPPDARAEAPVPAVVYLAGLECDERTFAQKGGFQRVASELGLAVITPDTSPREARFPGDDASWDFGLAASFYVDATRAPWSAAYRMFTYVGEELVDLVCAAFPVDRARLGVMGHSMGGHGALVLALRKPETFRSVSALAPVASPIRSPWGQKAFAGYLGDDRAAWAAYDASALVAAGLRFPSSPLIDQGLADKFLETQLQPEHLEQACEVAEEPHRLRGHEDFDHSYYFVSTFVEDHLRHHARILKGPAAAR